MNLPDRMIFACSFSELYCQYVHEQHYGATEEAWRAVYQTPKGLTPPCGAGLAGNPVANAAAPGREPKRGRK